MFRQRWQLWLESVSQARTVKKERILPRAIFRKELSYTTDGGGSALQSLQNLEHLSL